MIKVNSQLAACSLSYAKIRVKSLTAKFLDKKEVGAGSFQPRGRFRKALNHQKICDKYIPYK